MERDRLLNICKWSYSSFDQAFNQLNTDRYFYSGQYSLDYSSIIDDLPTLDIEPPDRHELKVGLNQFGFYSWLPSDKNDLSFIQEYVVKPLPFTDIEDISEESKFVCDFVETYTKQEGFLTGVSLTQQSEDNDKYTVFFATSDQVKQASFFTFTLNQENLKLCATGLEKSFYLGSITDYCIWNVLGRHKI
jgi:hypothetical protein